MPPPDRAPAPAQFWEFVILVIGICESVRISAGWNSLSAPATEQMKEDYEPGEIGFDPLGLLPTDADAKYELQTKEINNGRLAMISIGAPLQPRKRGQPPQPQRSVLTPARSAAQLASRCRRRLTTSPSGAVRTPRLRLARARAAN